MGVFWLYFDFIKKHKLFAALALGIVALALLFMFFFSNKKNAPVKIKHSTEEDMVYFNVNPQIPVEPAQTEQTPIDESELKVDEFNQEMMQTLSPKASVNLPPQETETFIIPKPPRKKHHAQKYNPNYKTSQKQPVISYAKTCIRKIIQPQKKILKKITSPITLNLFQPTIKIIKLDYKNAFELADFINKNIPTEGTPLATAKGSGEIILKGSPDNISLAEKIISLLDTKPKIAVFKLNYTKPYKMANMLSNSIFSGDCNVLEEGSEAPSAKSPFTIYYNTPQNSLTIVGASSKQMDLAQEFINFSDVKSPQAFLDIILVEFNQKGIKQFEKIEKSKTCCNQCCLSEQNLHSAITTIINNGGGKILAKPHFEIANDSDYNLNITSDYVHSRSNKYVYNIEDCGTRLKIHSVINPKGEVFLTLEPNYITVKRSIPNERNAKATLFNRKCFRYENVKIENCQTLCFGGVNSQQEYNFLGFKRTKNTELMMFVNVHVLD